MVRGWCCRLLLDARATLGGRVVSPRAAIAVVGESAGRVRGLGDGPAPGQRHGCSCIRMRSGRSLTAGCRELSAPVFVEMLPLLRRAFADFTGARAPADGRKGEAPQRGSRRSPDAARAPAESAEIDHERAARVLPILAHILGTK